MNKVNVTVPSGWQLYGKDYDPKYSATVVMGSVVRRTDSRGRFTVDFPAFGRGVLTATATSGDVNAAYIIGVSPDPGAVSLNSVQFVALRNVHDASGGVLKNMNIRCNVQIWGW